MHRHLLLVSFASAAARRGKGAQKRWLTQSFEFDIVEQKAIANILSAIETSGALSESREPPTILELTQKISRPGRTVVEKLPGPPPDEVFDDAILAATPPDAGRSSVSSRTV